MVHTRKEGKQNKIGDLITQYGSFEMKPEESANEYVIRFGLLLRELQALNQTVTQSSKISRLREGLVKDEYSALNCALYLLPDDVSYEVLSKKIEQFDDTKAGRRILDKKRRITEEEVYITLTSLARRRECLLRRRRSVVTVQKEILLLIILLNNADRSRRR